MTDETAEDTPQSVVMNMVVGRWIAQMITAEPKTADFCGEILKFARDGQTAVQMLESTS